jgi:hypothetical protein
MGNQRIGDFAERRLNRPFVRNLGLVAFRLGELHSRLDAAGGKNGLRNLWSEVPDAVLAGKEASELCTLAADRTGEADLRKIRSLGDTDVGVGGDKRLFGRANIGARSSSVEGNPAGTSGVNA